MNKSWKILLPLAILSIILILIFILINRLRKETFWVAQYGLGPGSDEFKTNVNDIIEFINIHIPNFSIPK